jgi:hypothetical protein
MSGGQNVSENALQILYWRGRVRCGAEEKIEDMPRLRTALASRLTAGAQLAQTDLREIVLEGAVLEGADLSGAALVAANCNEAVFRNCNLRKAQLPAARLENALLEQVDLREANLASVAWKNATLRHCDVRGAVFDPVVLGAANLERVQGVIIRHKRTRESIEPVVQLGSPLHIRAMAFSREGDLLALGGHDGVIRPYRARDGRLLCTLEGHQRRVNSVAFDPAGRTLASGSADNTVKLWEPASGRLLYSLEGHLGPVYTVRFAPYGRFLVAAGAAGRVQFWDVEKCETFLYLYAFGPGAWLALLPDGRFDGTPDALRYLYYTERGTYNSFTAEELLKEFHDPKAIQAVLAKYKMQAPRAS